METPLNKIQQLFLSIENRIQLELLDLCWIKLGDSWKSLRNKYLQVIELDEWYLKNLK